MEGRIEEYMSDFIRKTEQNARKIKEYGDYIVIKPLSYLDKHVPGLPSWYSEMLMQAMVELLEDKGHRVVKVKTGGYHVFHPLSTVRSIKAAIKNWEYGFGNSGSVMFNGGTTCNGLYRTGGNNIGFGLTNTECGPQ